MLNQLAHYLGIAVAGRVVDRLVSAAIDGRCQLRMPAQQRAYPRAVREKDGRQKLARQVIRRPHMGIQRAILDEQRNDRLIVRRLASVVHDIAIVGRQVGASFNVQS